MKSPTVKLKIIDTAERLFAQKGYHGISVRDITKAADVRLASVNYYFKTKERLYHEILERRAKIIIKDRRDRLASMPESGLNPTQAIRQICSAIISPLFEKLISNEPGWRSYVAVVAKFTSSEITPGEDPSTLNALNEVSLEFISALNKFSIHPTDQQAHMAYQMLTGTALYAMVNNGRLSHLSDGEYRSDDYPAILETTLEFTVAGVEKLLTGQ
ncbi:MAG: TetR family transcriptional regulator [Gammaproteobacteria bacterium]|nr:TetR family transcriptional regulator [Gammaproteobacteria bacterium]